MCPIRLKLKDITKIVPQRAFALSAELVFITNASAETALNRSAQRQESVYNTGHTARKRCLTGGVKTVLYNAGDMMYNQ